MQNITVTSQMNVLGPQILKAGIWRTVLQLTILLSICLLLDGMAWIINHHYSTLFQWIIGYQKPSVFPATQLFIQRLCTRDGLSLLLDLGINCLFSTYRLFNERKIFHTLSSEALIAFTWLFIVSLFFQTHTLLGKHLYITLRYMDMPLTLLFFFCFLRDYFNVMEAWLPRYTIWNPNTIKGYTVEALYIITYLMAMGFVSAMCFPLTVDTALASHIKSTLMQCTTFIKASPSLIHSLFGYRALLYMARFFIALSTLPWIERLFGICHLSFQNIHILYTRYKAKP